MPNPDDESHSIDGDEKPQANDPRQLSGFAILLLKIGETEFKPPTNGITVLVGPNNVGKTQALMDIERYLAGEQLIGFATVKAVPELPFEQVAEWLCTTCGTDGGSRLQRGAKSLYGVATRKDAVLRSLTAGNASLQQWPHFTVRFWGVEERLRAAVPTAAFDLDDSSVDNAFAALLREPARYARLREVCASAFGQTLLLSRQLAAKFTPRWGSKATVEYYDAAVSDDVRSLLTADILPLYVQGNGVRGFVATLAAVSAAVEPILLIDEPEAFLPPPQAYRLGRALLDDKTSRQLFVATHSADFLRGVVDSGVPLEIVHLRKARRGRVPDAFRLPAEDVKSLFSDPFVRFSRALEGLFHDAVVVCESPSDCGLYQYVFDTVVLGGPGGPVGKPSVLFCYGGGKQNFPAIVSMLTKLRVPTFVIADFDILFDVTHVRNTLQALGYNWTGDDAGTHRVTQLHELTARKRAEGEPHSADDIRKDERRNHLKSSGKTGLEMGAPTEAGERLLKSLATRRLHVVPVGELECWIRAAGKKGAGWLQQAFEVARTNPEVLDPIAEFLVGLGLTGGIVRTLPRAGGTTIDQPPPGDVLAAEQQDAPSNAAPTSPGEAGRALANAPVPSVVIHAAPTPNDAAAGAPAVSIDEVAAQLAATEAGVGRLRLQAAICFALVALAILLVAARRLRCPSQRLSAMAKFSWYPAVSSRDLHPAVP